MKHYFQDIKSTGALIVGATLRDISGAGEAVTANLMIDSGAARSLISERLLRSIGLEPWDWRPLHHARGQSDSDTPVFQVLVTVPGTDDDGRSGSWNFWLNNVSGVEDPVIRAYDGFLGRDFMSFATFVYDGPSDSADLAFGVTNNPPLETSLVPLDPATHLPAVPSESLPAHEWKPPRVSWDLLLSGRAPLVLLPEGARQRPRITTALARLLTREGIADAGRWMDLHAACGLAARLFVVDRTGERWEVMDVLLDRGGETGRLELAHLGPRGARTVDVHEGFGHMLPVVVYRPGRPVPKQRPVKSESEQIREEIAALWGDHDRCSVRHGQFEAARIVERIRELEARLSAIEGPRPNPARSPDAWKIPPPCDVEATGRPLTKAIARRLEGEPVRVHLNLHNGCYVFTHGGLVTAYARFFHLRDILPRVGVGGYKRCHELKVRNVHAYLEGTFVNSGEPPAKRGKGWRQITYNCKTNPRPCFYYVDNDECFEGADEVRAWRVDNGDGTERCEVWVKGPPPERKKNPPECACTIPGGACACGAVDAECARVVACGPSPV